MARGLALSPDSPVAIELDTRHLIDHCISQLATFDHHPA
jgi:hypothetical protein